LRYRSAIVDKTHRLDYHKYAAHGERRRDREAKNRLRSPKEYSPADRELPDTVRCWRFSMRNYLLSLTPLTEMENLIVGREGEDKARTILFPQSR